MNTLTAEADAAQHPLVAEQLSGAIITAFVPAAVPDGGAGAGTLRPRIVKWVLDEMHDDPARPWTASEMAEVAGGYSPASGGLPRMRRGQPAAVPRRYLAEPRARRVAT